MDLYECNIGVIIISVLKEGGVTVDLYKIRFLGGVFTLNRQHYVPLLLF